MKVWKVLIFLGITLIIIGLLFWIFENIFKTQKKFPLDILIQKEKFTIYIPIFTSLIISIVLSIVIYLIQRFIK